MERFNQPPKTEGCLVEGQRPANVAFDRVERPSRSVLREKREPQAGVASGLSNSASKVQAAGGDVVCLTEPNRKATASGEVVDHLPGSKSVARVEGDTRNWGGPESSCRTNCEGQAGREAQRQAALPDTPGVGFVHSSQRQDACLEAGEGTNRLTKHAQATRCRKNDGPKLANLPAGDTQRVSLKSPVRETLHAGICEGGAGQPVSLPRQPAEDCLRKPESRGAEDETRRWPNREAWPWCQASFRQTV
jgi:hypothetical protein